jgi:hypothetical protein
MSTMSLGLSSGWIGGSGSFGGEVGQLLSWEGGGGMGKSTKLGAGEGGTACMDAKSQ